MSCKRLSNHLAETAAPTCDHDNLILESRGQRSRFLCRVDVVRPQRAQCGFFHRRCLLLEVYQTEGPQRVPSDMFSAHYSVYVAECARLGIRSVERAIDVREIMTRPLYRHAVSVRAEPAFSEQGW